MSRPLEVSFWQRLRQLLRGLFLYNTVYWRRASDELKPPRMTREERLSMRPRRDLSVIKPREHPRAAILAGAPDPAVVAAGPIVSEPVPDPAPAHFRATDLESGEVRIMPRAIVHRSEAQSGSVPAATAVPPDELIDPKTGMSKRRRRRRANKLITTYMMANSRGFFGKFFSK